MNALSESNIQTLPDRVSNFDWFSQQPMFRSSGCITHQTCGRVRSYFQVLDNSYSNRPSCEIFRFTVTDQLPLSNRWSASLQKIFSTWTLGSLRIVKQAPKDLYYCSGYRTASKKAATRQTIFCQTKSKFLHWQALDHPTPFSQLLHCQASLHFQLLFKRSAAESWRTWKIIKTDFRKTCWLFCVIARINPRARGLWPPTIGHWLNFPSWIWTVDGRFLRHIKSRWVRSAVVP